jgi:hypothetical protein
VRGTPSHIAEKYGTLARDAHSAGDRVSAESYFQHAEHYNRIVAAAQAQQAQQNQNRDTDDDGDDNRGSQTRDEFVSDNSSGQDVSAPDQETADSDDGNRRRRRPQRSGGSEVVAIEPSSNEKSSDEPVANVPPGVEVSGLDDDAPRVKKPQRRKPRKTNGHDETAVTAQAPGDAGNAPDRQAQPANDPATDGDGENEVDSTKDGAAALAAFPD